MKYLLVDIPVDTGRKLNVLCTFSLRPVSTGILLNQLFYKTLKNNCVLTQFVPMFPIIFMLSNTLQQYVRKMLWKTNISLSPNTYTYVRFAYVLRTILLQSTEKHWNKLEHSHEMGYRSCAWENSFSGFTTSFILFNLTKNSYWMYYW